MLARMMELVPDGTKLIVWNYHISIPGPMSQYWSLSKRHHDRSGDGGWSEELLRSLKVRDNDDLTVVLL